MANDNLPRGLFPIDGTKCKINYYRVGTATDVFLGQPVDLASTGYITNAIDVTTAGIVQAIGVAVGFAGPLKKGLATDDPYLDASDLTTLASGLEAGDRWVAVADDPQQLFIVQGDTGGTLATLSAAGETVPLIYRATSGNTDNGWANLELDASGNAASTGQIVRLIRLHDAVNVDGTENTAGANYTKWVVQIQTHRRTASNLASAI